VSRVIVVAGVLVVATLVVMTAGWAPPVIALGSAIVIAGLLGIAPASALFGGLSNAGVITVAAMLVIAKGIVQTGVVSRVAQSLLRTTHSAIGALGRLVVPVGVASGLMNTTPIVAMLIPATRRLEQTRGIPAREVMLPIAHVTTLTGTITLIGTSSNLLIAGIAGEHGVSMSMLSFAPVALPVAVFGAAVVILLGPRMLRVDRTASAARLDWRVELIVGERALVIGRTAGALGLASARDYQLLAVHREGDTLPADVVVHADDRLVFAATEAGIPSLWQSPYLGHAAHRLFTVSVKTGVTGTLNDLGESADIEVIAARTRSVLRATDLRAGATCYVTAPSAEIVENSEYVALWQDAGSRAPQPGRTWVALLILAAVVLTASFGVAPIEFTSIAGAILMVLTGVLTPRSAARALDWNVLFILAGSVGLGAIVIYSGLADVLATAIGNLVGDNRLFVIVVFAVVTALLTNVISNAAAASILTPVAITVAASAHIDPVVLLAVVGTCISLTFLNPFSHQTNLMVIGPIGYTTGQFVRLGIPVLLGALIVTCAIGVILA
jgi:di/tricarboxylate transporter